MSLSALLGLNGCVAYWGGAPWVAQSGSPTSSDQAAPSAPAPRGGVLPAHSKHEPALLGIDPTDIKIGVDHNRYYSVHLENSANGLVVQLALHSTRDGSVTGTFPRADLIPLNEPALGCKLAFVQAQAQVNGFSVEAHYACGDGADQFQLQFEFPPNLMGDGPSLVVYRKERLDSTGVLQSGLVADYRLGVARYLGSGNPDGQGPRSQLPALPLQPGVPLFKNMASLYGFTPLLQVDNRNFQSR